MDLDERLLIQECVNGWQECKDEFIRQLAGPVAVACASGDTEQCRDTAIRETLRKLVESENLPPEVVPLGEACVHEDKVACQKVATILAAHGACLYATGSSCPVCCATVVGPIVEFVWPVIDDFVEDVSDFLGGTVNTVLEFIGVKDAPEFADIADPMQKKVCEKTRSFVANWEAAMDGAESEGFYEAITSGMGMGAPNMRIRPPKMQLAPEVDITMTKLDCLRVALEAARFHESMWLPAAGGTVSVNPSFSEAFDLADYDPCNYLAPKWHIPDVNAYNRNDKYADAAEKLAQIYAVKMDRLKSAVTIATGHYAAVRQAQIEAKIDLAGSLQEREDGGSLLLWLLGLGAVGVAGWYGYKKWGKG